MCFGLSCEKFNIGSLLSCNVFLNFTETVLHCFQKVQSLTAGKHFKIAQHYFFLTAQNLKLFRQKL